MIYREAGQFKTSYASDQAIFPIVQDRVVVAGAMVAAVLIPLAIRAILRGGEFIEAQTWNALAANSFAVMLSMWFRVSIDQYPGNRASYLLFPSIVAGHAFNAVAFLFTRVGYDRLVLLLGLIGHLVFAYALLMLLRRHQRSATARCRWA